MEENKKDMLAEEAQSVETSASDVSQLHGEYKLLVLLFVIGAALCYEAMDVKGIVQGVSSGPGSIPQLVTILLLLLIGVEACSLFRKGYKEGSGREMLDLLFDKDVITLLVTVVAYGLLIETFGFVITSTVYLFVTMYLLDRKQPLKKLLISVGTVAVLYLIFSTIFQVVLP